MTLPNPCELKKCIPTQQYILSLPLFLYRFGNYILVGLTILRHSEGEDGACKKQDEQPHLARTGKTVLQGRCKLNSSLLVSISNFSKQYTLKCIYP